MAAAGDALVAEAEATEGGTAAYSSAIEALWMSDWNGDVGKLPQPDPALYTGGVAVELTADDGQSPTHPPRSPSVARLAQFSSKCCHFSR